MPVRSPRISVKRGRRLCQRPLFDSGDQVCSKGSRPGKALLQRIQRLSGIRSVCGDRDPRPRSDGQGEHTQQAFGIDVVVAVYDADDAGKAVGSLDEPGRRLMVQAVRDLDRDFSRAQSIRRPPQFLLAAGCPPAVMEQNDYTFFFLSGQGGNANPRAPGWPLTEAWRRAASEGTAIPQPHGLPLRGPRGTPQGRISWSAQCPAAKSLMRRVPSQGLFTVSASFDTRKSPMPRLPPPAAP